MITGQHTYIRSTEPDDVSALAALYREGGLRAGLLDVRREPVMPTRDELRELVSRKEIQEGGFHTVEDREGSIRGFCTLRGVNPEARYAEYSLLLLESERYVSPLAREAHNFLLDRAFVRLGLRKVVGYGFPHETEWLEFLQQSGFTPAGAQREVVYARGQWHDIQAFSLATSSEDGA